MGETLIPLPISQPSTLLNYQEQVKGREIAQLFAVRFPTYNLRDFEREIFVADLTITGDGVAFPLFLFAPNIVVSGQPTIFPKNRSVRILRASLLNADVVEHRLQLLAVRPVSSIVPDVVTKEGHIQCLASFDTPVIGTPAVAFGASDEVVDVIPEYIELYSNKPGGVIADFLRIPDDVVLSNLLTLRLSLLWETIPDPVEWTDGSLALTGTP